MIVNATTPVAKCLRVLLALALALLLHAPGTAGSATTDRGGAAGIFVAAPHPAGIQLNRSQERFENLKQSSSADSPFVLLAAGGRIPDDVRRAGTLAGVVLRSLAPAHQLSGRSPPGFLF